MENTRPVKVIVKTSEQGYHHTRKFYEVTIHVPPLQYDCAWKVIRELDYKYGGDGRFTSTDIEDLQKGAIASGYEWSHVEIEEPIGGAHYAAITGNY